MATGDSRDVWPLAAATSLVLLKGTHNQAAEAMKLTMMELVVLGKLRIRNEAPRRRWFGLGTRSPTAEAWVPMSAAPPTNATQLSVFEAARRLSSQDDPASVIDIADAAKWIAGQPSRSTLDSWLFRFPLAELYDKGLMQTRRRFLLRDIAEPTESGHAVRADLRRRLESLQMMPGMDKKMAAHALHLAGTSFLLVDASWPAVEAVIGSIKRDRDAAAGSTSGGETDGDGDGFAFDVPDIELPDIDVWSFDIGDLDFGGVDLGGGGGGGGDG